MSSCGLRLFSSQQCNHSVNAHLRASTERVSGIAGEVVVCSSFNTQWTFPTALNSMFMMIGGADTLCTLQLFRIFTFLVALFRQRKTRDWPPLRGHDIHLVLRRESPCEVAESVIRRPQNTISWTGSEPENRDAVCVGFLRNSTVMPSAVRFSRQCCRWQCGQSWRSLLF